ncbi:sulfotransferase family protein [Haloglycomyces albus]|uniref:sulfotransferase family protein n=1 Tax=Haloglycomyces albus TaxID=526067 RepID=UPI00046D41F1|nr:sulfotransferase family protein [Haloglycomyces albus]
MLQIIGAGLPRTGTMTLKTALERLLGQPCHHMIEVFENRDRDLPRFNAVLRGEEADWSRIFSDYAAAVDWPSSAFWRELLDAFPEAPVVLSQRDSPAQWLRSMQGTILPGLIEPDWENMDPQHAEMLTGLWDFATGGIDPTDEQALTRFYEQHLDTVRNTVPAHRLLEFRPDEGWGPLCEVLGVAEPDEPFPHVNTTAEFQARADEIRRDR